MLPNNQKRQRERVIEKKNTQEPQKSAKRKYLYRKNFKDDFIPWRFPLKKVSQTID